MNADNTIKAYCLYNTQTGELKYFRFKDTLEAFLNSNDNDWYWSRYEEGDIK